MANEESTHAQAPLKTCREHGDLLDMFCVDCEKNICLICGQQKHGSHDWSRTTKVFERVRSELAALCEIVRQEKIPLLHAEEQKIRTLRETNGKLFTEKMKQISSHTDVVVTTVQKLSEDMVKNCKYLKSQNEDKLDTKESEIERFLTGFECCLQSVEDECKTDNMAKLLQIKRDVLSVPTPLKLTNRDMTLHHIDFKAGEIQENALQSVLGEIYQTYKRVTVSKLFEEKKGTKMIKYVSPISENQAWYREFRSSENVLIDINKGTTETACMFGELRSDHIPDDFITLENGVNIYTWHAGHCVMKISPPKVKESEMVVNKVSKVADLSPLYPVGVCATVEGRIIVSAIDTPAFSEDLFTYNQPRKSVVLILSESGKVKKVFQYADDEKTSLFLYPYRMAENTKGDICVINRTGTTSGQVCVLSSVGKLQFYYNGTGPNKYDFDPRGICCDSGGNILVGDSANKCVHLVDQDGTFLTYLIKCEEDPWSMALFQNSLWIGGKNGSIFTYRYQLRNAS